MKDLKKLIAKILIVSMILTSHSFFNFAEGVQDSTVGASFASPEEETSPATNLESRKELIELLNKNRHRKASESILDLFGNSYEFDNLVLYAYVNIGPQANMNLSDGYTKVSDSFNEKYPQTEFLYYQLEEGEGDEYEDGESFEFNYPDPYSYLYEQMEYCV